MTAQRWLTTKRTKAPFLKPLEGSGKKVIEDRDHEKTTTMFLRNWAQQLKSPPNIITSLRILSTPYLSFLIVSEQYDAALGGCLIAGLSDFMDGFLARRYNMKTVLGKCI